MQENKINQKVVDKAETSTRHKQTHIAEHILLIHPILREICNEISMFRISHQFNLPSSKYPKTLILLTLVLSLTFLALT
jgi:hypothetical protein